jgi:hypothetical protein
MRPIFGREYIENKFQRIGDGLSEPLTIYLIGGGAMSLSDLEGATKDIDIIVPGGDAYGQLWAVLMDLGYAEVQSLEVPSVTTVMLPLASLRPTETPTEEPPT